MRVWGSANVLTEEEIGLIERSALRILEEIGVVVPNRTMLDRLAQAGAVVDREQERVRFPVPLMRDFVAGAEAVSWDEPRVAAYAGAYSRSYIPSGETEARPSTLGAVADGLRLADYLDTVDGVGCPGTPTEVAPILAPLLMRLLCWRFAERRRSNCGELWDTRLCPFVKEMGEVAAELEGGATSDWAHLAMEMISPLRLGAEEAKQYVYFWENGLPVGVGNMLSAGGSAPATLAGAVALQLAETLFLNFLSVVFADGPEREPADGPYQLSFGASVSVLDMKHGIYPYGRPEIALTHLAVGQLARHYRASFGSNSFSGDAKVPGPEAGMQKAFSAVAGIIAGTRSLGSLGLLSVDEIYSFDQLVIDGEFASALKRLARGFEVSEESIAYDVIEEVGPGGIFTDHLHTVTHYRSEHWQPQLFSREMLATWLREGARTDLDKAREVCREALKTHHPKGIEDETVAELLKVIHRAAGHFDVPVPPWPF